MTTLYLDLETYSDVPITYGTHAYAEKAEVLLCAWAWDDGPVEVTDMTLPGARGGDLVGWFERLIAPADEIVIHNSAFDRTILRHQGVEVPPERIRDSMVLAMSHSLPGSLGQLCDVLGVPSDKAKDKEGKKLIQLFTKPRPKNTKLRRATRDTHPEEWAAFIEYARLDVVAMRDVYRRLPRWNDSDSERALWRLDQVINDRGIAVDAELARSALRAFERSARSLTARSTAITNGAVGSLTQRAKLMSYMDTAHDFRPADLTKGTVSAFLSGTAVELDPELRELLEIRQQASATSPAKYKVLLNATSPDGRLRGILQFCGAIRTGRWGGRLFQPQNLPRPTLKADDIELGIEAMKLDCEDLLYENVAELCSSAVRGCLVARPGHKLVVSDLSNIEGRVLAWLAGEVWKIKAFADYDKGTGHDLYVLAYAKSFGLTAEVVLDNKKNGDGRMRQIGKVMELAFGYQGSVGAFATMGAIYGVELPEDEVLENVKAWRKAHRNVVGFWYDIDNAVKAAIAKPGTRQEVGLIAVGYSDRWLRIRLPSGRRLCYPNARVEDDGQIAYDGVNQYTRKWETLRTYGGKLVENIVQAVARDVLAHGMVLAEDAGYKVCLHVHDELITETPDDPAYSVGALSSLMATNPGWALGLPLAAAGFETSRYRKD